MNEKIVLVIPAPTDDGHIDAMRVLRELLRAWMGTGICAVVLGALGFAIALVTTPIYRFLKSLTMRSSGQWPRNERASR